MTPSIINTELWAHQNTASAFALNELDDRGYAWWVLGCAVGKTLAAYNVIMQSGAKKTLVLTKKTIIDQAWGGNAEKYTDGLDVRTYTQGTAMAKAGTIIQSAKLGRSSPPYVAVLNYETAALIADQLKAVKFDMVIADESHKLKTHNSKQSQALAMGLSNVKWHLALTGTPYDDRPTDAFGQVRWLDGGYRAGKSVGSKVFGTWTNFFEEYVVYRQIDNIKIPVRYKKQDQLREILDPFTLHMKTEDVLTLPPVTEIDREVEWTPDLRKAYREMKTDMIAKWNGHTMVADNAMTQALRLHQLTGGYFTDDQGNGQFIATPKIDTTLDILDEIGGLPTVIFTIFDTDVQALKPALERAGHKVKLLIGGTYEHEEFQHGDGDVILVNLATGNAGIELTRARFAIYYSIGNSRTNYTQSRWRIRRPDSDIDLPITYYNLMLPRSIDVDLRKAMNRKGKVSDYLLDRITDKELP